jgi:catechol 2,3-dioxygenase-like lactoylglutathione lyase family enzyme
MINFAYSQLWVHDQDESLAFYTETIGWEVKVDVTIAEMGDFRWLVVGPPEQSETGLVLMAIPGAPVLDNATATQIRDLMGKGFAGTVFMTTDDVRALVAELQERGVELTDELEERPYGTDCGFRVPSGNAIRLTQHSGDLA